MKRLIILLMVSAALFSCNPLYEKAMKSTEPLFVYDTANQLFEDEKWEMAITLYERIESSYAGTDKGRDILYKKAKANFSQKNYRLASLLYKRFYVTYPTDTLREESLYNAAYCAYLSSPDYNLDPTNTLQAIEELQDFADTYPDSEKVADINNLIDELQFKLEKKAFENAKTYYRTIKFKAAKVSFADFLDDYPDSNLREEAGIYLLRSMGELAINSQFDKLETRILDAQTQYRIFKKKYPNSEYIEEAESWNEKMKNEQIKFEKLEKEIEEFKRNQLAEN